MPRGTPPAQCIWWLGINAMTPIEVMCNVWQTKKMSIAHQYLAGLLEATTRYSPKPTLSAAIITTEQ